MSKHELRDENGRCVPERENVPAIGLVATIVCMFAAVISHKRLYFDFLYHLTKHLIK